MYERPCKTVINDYNDGSRRNLFTLKRQLQMLFVTHLRIINRQ